MIHLYQAIRNIAFVCVIREENFDKMGLINYNLSRVSDCLKELYEQEEWNCLLLCMYYFSLFVGNKNNVSTLYLKQ